MKKFLTQHQTMHYYKGNFDKNLAYILLIVWFSPKMGGI